MQLKVTNIHQISIKIHFLILIAVVVANGRLLLTTGDISLIFWIMAKQYAIKVKDIHQKSIKIHFIILIAVVVANGRLLHTTGDILGCV